MEVLKPWTGGDPQTCRELFGKLFTYIPKGHIFIAANNQPALTERTDAAWGRLHQLHFGVKFTEEQKDRKLHDKLKAEISGILNWAIEGLKDYNTLGGLCPPESVKKAIAQYRLDNDTVRQFIDECCTIGSGMMSGPELYASYKQFCSDAGQRALGSGKFNRFMADAPVMTGATRTRTKI